MERKTQTHRILTGLGDSSTGKPEDNQSAGFKQKEGRSEGVARGLSCAGIFGSEDTKTVVMEHHWIGEENSYILLTSRKISRLGKAYLILERRKLMKDLRQYFRFRKVKKQPWSHRHR